MRRACYWGGLPSAEWILSTALVYDAVLISVFDELRRTTKIPDDEPGNILSNLEMADAFTDCLDLAGLPIGSEFIHDADKVIDWWDLIDGDPTACGSPEEFNVLVNQYDDIDFYRPGTDIQSGLLPAVTGTMNLLQPTDPLVLTVEQVTEFRGLNELRRVKFQNAASELIKSFGEAGTEAQARRVLRLIEESLQEEYSKLELIYRHTRIEAATRAISTMGAPPAILGVVGSVLGISCVEVAGFVGSVALAIVPWLIAKEKSTLVLNDCPWAYLWHAKRLVSGRRPGMKPIRVDGRAVVRRN